MGKESGLPSEIQIVSLIDDWKPYQVAKEAGVQAINFPVCPAPL